ncbi:hypothetical protein [Cupriavidus sp. BIS7]|uniref:hypothetical protein n=1 Tax=Cupriavidus sp. BIS7 TaxID=1217718 RepID=UPI0012F68D7A|nr:hypothetical protein [Cupriavidus sp. BIS7]
MTRIDENIGVKEYFVASSKTLDGLVCFVLSSLSLLMAVGLLLGYEFLPLRVANGDGKKIVLLMSSPILLFLILVRLRQLPFSDGGFSVVIRAVLCAAFFWFINFYNGDL